MGSIFDTCPAVRLVYAERPVYQNSKSNEELAADFL